MAGRTLAEVSPGLHAPRLAAPRRRGARFWFRLQSLRPSSTRGDRAGDADRAPAAHRPGSAGGHRPSGGRRSPAAPTSSWASRRRILAGGRTHRRFGPPCPAPERHPSRRRRPRVLPSASAIASAGVSGGPKFRGASRPGHASACMHQLDPPRRHRRPAATGGSPDRSQRSRALAPARHRGTRRAQHDGAQRGRGAEEDRSRPTRARVRRGARRCAWP